jgi:SAM-dependent methyltransferase
MSGLPADANAAQRRYWNDVAGPRRIAAQSFIENRNRESNELLLARLGLKAGERVLEIGCGTGPTTVRLAEMVGPEGRVVAVDISEPMLKVARERTQKAGFANAEFVLGDAQVVRFEPSAFDLATSRMGVMFFADPVAAFHNVLGALKPDGRLIFACWAPLAENPHWLFTHDIAEKHLGSPAPRPPHEPGPHAFGDPAYLEQVLTQAGFADVVIERAHPVVHGANPEEEARQAVQTGPVARLIEEKNPEPAVRERIAQDIEAAFAALAATGPIRLASTIFLVGARRPG